MVNLLSGNLDKTIGKQPVRNTQVGGGGGGVAAAFVTS